MAIQNWGGVEPALQFYTCFSHFSTVLFKRAEYMSFTEQTCVMVWKKDNLTKFQLGFKASKNIHHLAGLRKVLWCKESATFPCRSLSRLFKINKIPIIPEQSKQHHLQKIDMQIYATF